MPVDQRFFSFKGPQPLRSLLGICGLDAEIARDVEVHGIAAASIAATGDLCFYEGPASKAKSVSPKATACLVNEVCAGVLPDGVLPVVVPLPRFAHKQIGEALFELKEWNDPGDPPSIHPSAEVAPTAHIAAGAAIGEDARIGPGVAIGPGVQIGARTVIDANASIRNALIGNDVKIYSGAVIGAAGFGVTAGPDGAEDAPQWGRVILQDHVTIGANSCVDRGAFGDTIMGERTKLDNMVQIGHNVVVGRNVVMASFVGISGSSTIGDGVEIGGQVGISNNVHIGAGARIAATAGIFRDIPPGETWGGLPAKPLKQYMREIAWIQKQIAPKKKPK